MADDAHDDRLRQPEQIMEGLALMMGAWLVLVLGLPLYLLVLRARIVQEEQVMRQHFPGYATRPLPPRVQDTTLGHPSA